MTRAKSPKPQNLVVVEHKPWRAWVYFCIAFVCVCVFSVLGYLFGGYVTTKEVNRLAAENGELNLNLESANSTIEKLRQQVANLRLGSEIDQRANDDVRVEVVSLKDKIAALEADISFYRGIMAPKDNVRGLTIGQVNFIATGVPRHYQYRMVVQQLATNHKLISGSLSVTVVGRQGDETRQIPLKEISEQIDDERIKLRFKYFQNVEGELVLPEGFEPERIELIAKSSSTGQSVEKKFGWLVQET